jgi:integrase
MGTLQWQGNRCALYLPINGKKKYIGTFASEEDADAHVKTVVVESRGSLGAPTWREIGNAYLLKVKRRLKSYDMYRDTFNSVICAAPFIDEPIDVTTRPTMVKWADELPDTLKKRSVVVNGKRKTITVKGERISHAHAINSVAVLRGIWRYACDLGLLKEGDGLCARLHVPEDRTQNRGGKASRMPVLPLDEIELLLTCRTCSPDDPKRAADPEMLAHCPHCTFEVRVAYAIEIHQALRKGELQGMNWEACDWTQHGWHIRQNRDGSTKGRKDTWQAWLPRAERFLRKWHELAGHPETGIMFPSRGKRPKQTGPRRSFVASQPEHMSAAEVVARGEAQGIKLTVLAVHQYRSAERKVKATAPARRYAEDYDWGWSGNAGSKAKNQAYRPGWPERLGVKTQITFHQLRDTCASHLLSGSWGRPWDIKAVSVHLTHETVTITEKRYAHLLKDAKRRQAAATETDPTLARSVHTRYMGAEGVPSNYLESLAPELGLEPRTTRLTVERSTN